MKPEARDVVIWAALVGGPIAYDVWADRHRPRGTLSNLIVHGGRTRTPAGRLLLFAGWGALTYWLLPHLSATREGSVEP